jgi:hypothetical protein
MATTTNYGWTTPDNTALVKDGASAIRSLGTAIDTTVFANAGAAIAKSTVDAKGDLIAGTADNTVARLAVGANDTILVADSSTATGLKWAAPAAAGGMTLINSGNTSLAGVDTLTISSIPGTYKHLYIVGMGIRTTNSYGAAVWCRVNGTTSTSYYNMRYQVVANAINGDNSMTNTSYWFVGEVNNGTGYKGVTNFEMSIPLYADTTQLKVAQTFSNRGTDDIQSQVRGTFNSASAITSLTFFSSNVSTGNFVGDSAVYVYGVN